MNAPSVIIFIFTTNANTNTDIANEIGCHRVNFPVSRTPYWIQQKIYFYDRFQKDVMEIREWENGNCSHVFADRFLLSDGKNNPNNGQSIERDWGPLRGRGNYRENRNPRTLFGQEVIIHRCTANTNASPIPSIRDEGGEPVEWSSNLGVRPATHVVRTCMCTNTHDNNSNNNNNIKRQQ